MAEIKTRKEIEIMKRAATAGSAAVARALPLIRPGRTEIWVAEQLEAFAKDSPGYEGLSFPPIIASGPNGAQPHAVPSGRVLREGDFITVDFGVIADGYCSDMTRTFLLGAATERQTFVYRTVLAAQTAGVRAAKPGIACKALDRVCRGVIEEAGLGEYFIHTTGHGVGTEVHEDPRIGKDSVAVLAPGMVVTIEPGVYIEGWGGVRIEDTVVITKSGCEVITAGVSKELLPLYPLR
ncbi:MAG: aminopeptidase P family protein [Clostridiales Family XIII bacterium]|jgi:Xaa-Pro aminopeptidase|nr:aminopeptidase P family protein [Clostridiales Family XIII bacterium]